MLKKIPKSVFLFVVGLVFFLVSAYAYSLLAQPKVVTLVPQNRVIWKDFLGVNAHSLWFKPAIYEKQFEALKSLGLEWVRIDLHWANMEPKKGEFLYPPLDALVQTLSRMDLKSEMYLVGSARFASSAPNGTTNYDQYPPLDDQTFADRMADLARRYPSVNGWEVWNEPNLPAYWRPNSDAKAYGKLFAASEHALHVANPDAAVLLGGMAYFSQMPGSNNALMLDQLWKLGVFGLQPQPIVAYHPYSLYPSGDALYSDSFIKRADLVNRQLRAAGVRQIWANEWGWSSYSGPKEEQPIICRSGQTQFVLKRLALMSTMDFDKIFLFTLSDLDGRASPRDQHYGLLDLQGNPKPVYYGLQRFLQTLGPEVIPTAPIPVSTTVQNFYDVTWKKTDGSRVFIYWGSKKGSATVNVSKGRLLNPATGATDELTAGSDGILVLPVSKEIQMLVVD